MAPLLGTDPTNRQGTVTLPSYNVLKGSATPNTVGNGTVNFNATPARSVADVLTNGREQVLFFFIEKIKRVYVHKRLFRTHFLILKVPFFPN